MKKSVLFALFVAILLTGCVGVPVYTQGSYSAIPSPPPAPQAPGTTTVQPPQVVYVQPAQVYFVPMCTGFFGPVPCYYGYGPSGFSFNYHYHRGRR